MYRELLRKLCAVPCLPTLEHEFGEIIKKELADIDVSYRYDSMGNLIINKEGKKGAPLLMLAAHMDEIGLMVSAVEPSGLLRFEKLGWIDDGILPARLVWVHTKNGRAPGVIGIPSPREQDEKRVKYSHNRLFIDIGCSSLEECASLGVRVGDVVSFKGDFVELQDQYVVTRAVDDRAGIAAVIGALKLLKDASLEVNLAVVITTQHEVGLRGPQVVGFGVAPDYCLIVDVTGNFPDQSNPQVRLREGPVVRFMEDYGTNVAFGAQKGLIADRRLVELILTTADNMGMPHQLQVKAGAIGDGTAIHISGAGVPTASVLIPTRYNHSINEMVSITDIESTAQLLAKVVQRLA